MLAGTVKTWNDEEAWGVLVAPDVPEDIWAHFSVIEGSGFRTLAAQQPVLLEVEDLGGPVQDGYRYRAKRVVAAT
jgi:CspA family cold shock protein